MQELPLTEEVVEGHFASGRLKLAYGIDHDAGRIVVEGHFASGRLKPIIGKGLCGLHIQVVEGHFASGRLKPSPMIIKAGLIKVVEGHFASGRLKLSG